MKRVLTILIAVLCTINLRAFSPEGFSIEDIIGDIYAYLTESGEVDYEELQTELLDIAANPINLNATTEDELRSLRFLTPTQIDAILLHAYKTPFQSLYELQLLPELQDYEVRDLLPFVKVEPSDNKEPIYPREVFRFARHELLARTDVRNIEAYDGDPVFAQLRYRFNYRNQYQAGLTIRRAPGEPARAMQYGAYIELHDLWRFRTIVAGNFQAQFGQGLVVATPFHMGKSTYVLNAGFEREGLRKYSSPDGESFHGVGATIRAHEYVDVSVFYSMTAPNDSIYKHTIGANLTVRYNRLRVGITAVENIYTDSLRYYYENARYNQNYFRGNRQAVLGANFRWNRGILDLFGEVAAAQNRQWGWAATAGTRVTPISDIGLILLYRYYSPTFDNTWGYAFSETSRINDENGLYLGADIRRLRNWRFALYGDIFRFSGIKYGIPYAPSLGYDTQADISYHHATDWNMTLRLRAREKARKSTYSMRYQFTWEQAGWHLRTQLDANLVTDSLIHSSTDKKSHLSYGAAVSQDVQYSFSQIPMTLQFRAQAFDARNWDNRIYQYEHDVLNAFSIPATYGLGGRFYLNLRYRIIPQLSLYLKLSETIYAPSWAAEHSRPTTRTDIHLLLRAVL